MAVGLVIGVLWIVMALGALGSAASGLSAGRLDWGIGWGLVGVLLLAAGSCAIVATWWHQFRVLRED
ncbi:MAG TPA: hypothetical protein VNZ57_14550 [Longimicrobiales bacterium]|nr:hypothetical protein [Longimicrobiales bacterium]